MKTRLTIILDDDVKKKLKLLAIRRNTNMTEIVKDILKKHLTSKV